MSSKIYLPIEVIYIAPLQESEILCAFVIAGGTENLQSSEARVVMKRDM